MVLVTIITIFQLIQGIKENLKIINLNDKGKYFLRKFVSGEFKNGKNIKTPLNLSYRTLSIIYKGEFKKSHFHGKGILTINKNVLRVLENGEFIKVGAAIFIG